MLSDSFEVRPKARRNSVLLALGCLVFTLGGLWMIVEGEGKDTLAGLLGVVFFGGGGLYAVPKMLRRNVSMVLTRRGIEQHTLYGVAHILWKDTERIGVASLFGNKVVGVRLSTYNNYLADMSPQLAGFMTRSLPYLKLLARATSLLDAPAAVQLWSKLAGREDPSDALKDFGQVGNLAEALLWSRKTYGYDIVFTWADRDRSAERFVDLLEQYRKGASTQEGQWDHA
jgi:Protein of unknown function (DUF2982)